MFLCMKNAGLIDDGYSLTITVKNIKIDEGNNIEGTIWLAKDTDDSEASKLYQIKATSKGWWIINDPAIKSGCPVPEVRADKRSKAVEATARV
jgi:hypothetical protein